MTFTFTGLKMGDGTRLAVSGRSVWVMTAGRAQAHPYPLSRRFCALWLAQGSDTVELCLSTVLVLPNFARRSHHSEIAGGVEQFLFSTHKASVLKLLVFCAKIYNFFEKSKFVVLFFLNRRKTLLGRL